MDKALKILLNLMKCPVCGGQIDGTASPFNCAFDKFHYRVAINQFDLLNRINRETVEFYDKLHRYSIIQRHNYDNLNIETGSTSIIITVVDAEHNIDTRQKSKIFEYDKLLFDFKKTNITKLANKIKTILVFQ